MDRMRKIDRVLKSRATMEGAGVLLKRAFGNIDTPLLDPFLLLDDFHSDNPRDYIAGFPWHPHRGIETVTYMLHGRMKHEDSLKNSGVIESGGVQWMTAGGGIIHSEMPGQASGLLRGFQLWVNLPAKSKMMSPRYRDITKDQIPAVTLEGGVTVRIICGEVNGVRGPARDIIADPEYLDVTVPAGVSFEHKVENGHRALAYVAQGSGRFDEEGKRLIDHERTVIWGDGGRVVITAGGEDLRFLLLSGKPIGEPIAWYGPIVMNTEKELSEAFEEYRNGTFIS